MIENIKKPPHRSRVPLIFLVVGIVLVASNLRAPITALGPLMGSIVEDTDLSSALAGMLTTLPLLAFAAFSPLAPKLARRLGIELLLLSSLVLLAIGILLRSVPWLTLLFLGTILIGIAIAIGNVLLPSLIKRDFPHRVGFLTGIYTMSMSIWAATASGISIPLSHGFDLGWRNALMGWAILAIAGIAVWLPLARSRRLPVQHIKTDHKRNFWRSKVAWQVTLFMGLQSIGFYSTISWLPEVLHDRGISIASAGWLLSLMQFVSLPATFIVPVLAGRLQNQRGLVALIGLAFFMGYSGLLYGGTAWITFSIIMVGLGQGASISLALTLFGLRTSNAAEAAELSGMSQSIGYLLSAIGPVLFGLFHDLTQSWTVSLLFLFAASLLQLFAGLGAGRDVKVFENDSQWQTESNIGRTGTTL